MGWFNLPSADALMPSRTAQLASPWSTGLATSIIGADVFGASVNLPVTRTEAMRVPAVVAARDAICTALAAGVLKAYRKDVEVPTQPAWMYRSDSDVAPYTRMLWTADDLFFSGYAVWETIRSSAFGPIVDARRVPPESWEFDADGHLLINAEQVPASRAIVFTWINEGLLITAASAIRAALDLQAEVARRVRVPQAHTLLKATDPAVDLTDDERDKLLDAYVAARRSANGAASWIPFGIDVDRGGELPVSLYENGRNASVLDIARFSGVPAAMLDASAVSASLTYETRVGQRNVLNDRIRARALPIESRLSMDDVLPRGQRAVLDLSHLITDEAGTPAVTED